MLDAVHAGLERVGDGLARMGVRCDGQPEPVRLVDNGSQLLGENCGLWMIVPAVIIPPLAMTLITSQPRWARSLTAERTPSIPVAVPPRKWQCPPGDVIGGPAATIAGSGPRCDSRSASAR